MSRQIESARSPFAAGKQIAALVGNDTAGLEKAAEKLADLVGARAVPARSSSEPTNTPGQSAPPFPTLVLRPGTGRAPRTTVLSIHLFSGSERPEGLSEAAAY